MPNDPGFPGNTGITLAGTKYTQTYLNRIQAPQAWEYLQSCGKTPTAAVTAVLDSGVDASHLDLNGRLLPGQSFQGTPETTDETGHGTAVAGLIGASTNNAIGLAGVTWSGRNLVPIKIIDGTGGTTTAKLTQGLNAALARGAKVINMSVGTPGNPGDAALDAALNTAARSAVLIAAAGNTSNEGVYYPASNPNVIAVGAVGARNDVLACYSARPNDTVKRGLDLVAPGGAGRGRCPEATVEQDMLVLAPGNAYTHIAGTSEAAPLVSGVAALMRAANPDLSAAQTRTLLLSTANSSSGLPLLDATAAVRAALK
ncbi:S8 family serine peptidase [Deinococcus malanensis]